MKKVLILLAIISLLPLLGACASSTNPPEVTVIIATQTPAEELPESYPAPQQQNSQAYPYPDTEQAYPDSEQAAVPTMVPPDITPDPTMAMVKGVLLYNSKPVSGTILYLSKVVRSEDGGVGVVAFDRKDPTKTYTNAEGEFVFYNIPPGEYGLVIDTVVASYLLSYPDGEAEILLDLSSGDEVDLETLDYDNLPIPEP